MQWIILFGTYALLMLVLLAFGILMNRRYPLWLRPVVERYEMATRAQKAALWASNAAGLYLAMDAFCWLGARLGIPEFQGDRIPLMYRSPLMMILSAGIGALIVGFGSLLFVRSPNDEPRDWLTDLKNGNDALASTAEVDINPRLQNQ